MTMTQKSNMIIQHFIALNQEKGQVRFGSKIMESTKSQQRPDLKNLGLFIISKS